MTVIIEAALFLNAIISYLYTRDIMHPAVIVSSLWTFIVVLYLNINHVLFPISLELYKLIFYWTITFCFFSLVSSSIPIRSFKTFTYKGLGNIDKIYPLIIIFNIIFFILLYIYSGGFFSLADLRTKLVEEESYFPISLKIFIYINQFSVVYFFCYIYKYIDSKKKRCLILAIIILLLSIIKSNKTAFITLFFGIIYLMKVKGQLTAKRFLIIFSVLLLFIALVMIFRGDTNNSDFSIWNYILIYLLSPLPAMDMIINHEILITDGAWGSSTFRFVYRVLDNLDINCTLSFLSDGDPSEWVFVPLQTNVYTVLKSFYIDFGVFGILVFATILGLIWGRLYRLQKKGYAVFVIIYSTLIYSLYVQFFSDYFFGFFSVTLQNIIFSFIVFFYPFVKIKK